jgi:hypothetical protein
MWQRRDLFTPLITAFWGLSLCLTPGCGSSGRPVLQGTVTLDGQPVDDGAIAFISEMAMPVPPRAGALIRDGKYVIPADKAPPPGTYRVEIRWNKPTGKKIPSSDPPNLMDETRQVVPENYNTKSTLSEEVKPGANTFNYDLKSK